MKTAVVSHSALVQNDRMDAGFHVLNKQYEDAAKALEANTSKEQVISFLSDEANMPTSVLKLLAPLCRGSSEPGREQLLKAVVDYPHLSLAIIKDQGMAKLEERHFELAKQASAAEEALHFLGALGGSTSTAPAAPKKPGPGRG